jgi:hypothetical protein
MYTEQDALLRIADVQRRRAIIELVALSGRTLV